MHSPSSIFSRLRPFQSRRTAILAALRLLLLIGALNFSPSLQAQKFQWLGHLRGAPDYLPDDWEDPPPPGFKAWFSYAHGVSSGGRVVGSFVVLPGGSSADAAFRWESGEFTELPLSRANYVDATGRAVLGEKDEFNGQGGFVQTTFQRWEIDAMGAETVIASTNGETVTLPQNLSSISAYQMANGVWTETGPFANRRVRGVSADGSTFVGIKYEYVGGIAMRRAAIWRTNSETVLPLFSGTDVEMEALAVSGDGTKVVGFTHYPETQTTEERLEAFLWTEQDGVRTIADVAKALGIEWDETWEPEKATAISDNGRFVVGEGDRDGVYIEPWILELFPANDLIVNSTKDRPRAVGAIAGETGFTLPDGKPEVTLRSAIEAVNAGIDDQIRFDIPGAGVPVIQLSNTLPEINMKVEIDGTTQTAGKVEVRGMAPLLVGLRITGGNSIVRGLNIHSFTNKGAVCIELSGGGTNVIAGNVVGVDAAGATDGSPTGIRISGSAGNLIGGTAAADRNIVSGKLRAILIVGEGSDDNVITGNRIGMNAAGSLLGSGDGVEISHGNHNRVGSNAAGGGNAFGSKSGVIVNPEVPIDGVVIEGNRIGLDAAGISAGKPGVGILVSGYEEIQTMNARIADNLVAGGLVGIWLVGSVDTEISGNTVGLRFDGTVQVPSSAFGSSNFLYGIRTDLAKGAVIKDNVVAGHVWDIALSGAVYVESSEGDPDDPDDGYTHLFDPLELGAPSEDDPVLGNHRVENNIVGIKDGEKPAGIESSGGISIFGGAPSIHVSGNTVAGHQLYEIGVLNGSDHELFGNKVGTDSDKNYGSTVGILVSEPSNVAVGKVGSGNIVGLCALTGIAVGGGNTNVTIVGNQVGVAGSSAIRRNYTGIRIAKGDEGEKPTNVRIRDNRVGGNAVGISLENAEPVVLEDNIIGLHQNGTAATNVVGIEITDTIATLKNNTIASNALYGIQVESPATGFPVLIEGGSIFGNGPGEDFGIYYNSAQVARPSRFYASKTVALDGSGSYIFAAPPTGGSGSATFEVYGNPPDAIPQGQVSIVRQTVPANQGLAVRVPFTASSQVAGLEGFRATVTLGEATSAFSSEAEGEVLQPPLLDFSSESQPGIVSLTWDTGEQDIFRVVRSTSLDGPWYPVDMEPTTLGNRKTVSLPVTQDDAVYFRLELDPARLFQ